MDFLKDSIVLCKYGDISLNFYKEAINLSNGSLVLIVEHV